MSQLETVTSYVQLQVCILSMPGRAFCSEGYWCYNCKTRSRKCCSVLLLFQPSYLGRLSTSLLQDKWSLIKDPFVLDAVFFLSLSWYVHDRESPRDKQGVFCVCSSGLRDAPLWRCSEPLWVPGGKEEPRISPDKIKRFGEWTKDMTKGTEVQRWTKKNCDQEKGRKE